MKKYRLLIAAIFLIACNPFTLSAQEGESENDELAKDLANPIANLMSFPFQNNTNFGMGSYNRTQGLHLWHWFSPASGHLVF